MPAGPGSNGSGTAWLRGAVGSSHLPPGTWYEPAVPRRRLRHLVGIGTPDVAAYPVPPKPVDAPPATTVPPRACTTTATGGTPPTTAPDTARPPARKTT